MILDLTTKTFLKSRSTKGSTLFSKERSLRQKYNYGKIQLGVNYARCWIFAEVPFADLLKDEDSGGCNHGKEV